MNVRMGNLKLDGCNLAGKDLTGARLEDVSLVQADLRGAKLINARLIGVDLSAANLDNADLQGASIGDLRMVPNATFKGAKVVNLQVDRTSRRTPWIGHVPATDKRG